MEIPLKGVSYKYLFTIADLGLHLLLLLTKAYLLGILQ